jgi:hypothetical protein
LAQLLDVKDMADAFVVKDFHLFQIRGKQGM